MMTPCTRRKAIEGKRSNQDSINATSDLLSKDCWEEGVKRVEYDALVENSIVPRSVRTTTVPSNDEQHRTFLLDNNGYYIVEDSEPCSDPSETSPPQEDPLANTDPLALPSEMTEIMEITLSSPDSQVAPSPATGNTFAGTADVTDVAPKFLNLLQGDSCSSSPHSKISARTPVSDTSALILGSQPHSVLNPHTETENTTISRAVPISTSCSKVLLNIHSSHEPPFIIAPTTSLSQPVTTSRSASSSTFTPMPMASPSNGPYVPFTTPDPMPTIRSSRFPETTSSPLRLPCISTLLPSSWKPPATHLSSSSSSFLSPSPVLYPLPFDCTDTGPSRSESDTSPSHHISVAYKSKHSRSQCSRPWTQKTCSFFVPRSLPVPSSTISSLSTSQSVHSTSTSSASTSRSAPSRTVLLPPSDVPQYRKRPHSSLCSSSKKSNAKSKKRDKDCSETLPPNQKKCVPEQQEKAKRPKECLNMSPPARAKCFLIERQEALRKLWKKQNWLLDLQIETAEVQLAVYRKKLIVAESLMKQINEKNLL